MCSFVCLELFEKPLFKVSLIVLSSQYSKVLADICLSSPNQVTGVVSLLFCCSYGRCKLVLAASRLTVPTAITSPFDMGSGGWKVTRLRVRILPCDDTSSGNSAHIFKVHYQRRTVYSLKPSHHTIHPTIYLMIPLQSQNQTCNISREWHKEHDTPQKTGH